MIVPCKVHTAQTDYVRFYGLPNGVRVNGKRKVWAQRHGGVNLGTRATLSDLGRRISGRGL